MDETQEPEPQDPSPLLDLHTCVLCGEDFVGWGNNPEPLANFEDGRCCNDCNGERVIPERIRRMQGEG